MYLYVLMSWSKSILGELSVFIRILLVCVLFGPFQSRLNIYEVRATYLMI